MKKVLLLVVCLFFLVGCSRNEEKEIAVDFLAAKEKIINENAILIDVRTRDEYDKEHIDGAVLLTLDDINEDSVKDVIESKDSVIIVYCQSGNRSKQAVIKLNDLGYDEVYDLGSIDNWED